MIIRTFSNINIIIYNENGVKLQPKHIDNTDSLLISINENDILIEDDDFDQLLIKFNNLGFELLEDDFSKYISSGTTDKKSVQERIRMFKEFLTANL